LVSESVNITITEEKNADAPKANIVTDVATIVSSTTDLKSTDDVLNETQTSMIKHDLLSIEPYVNARNKYKIYYPNGWKVDSSYSTKREQFFLSPTIDKYGEIQYMATIMVSVSPNSGSALTIENCISKEKLEIMFNNYVLISDTRETIDGVRARTVSGTWDYGEITLRQTQQYIIKNGLLYIITATTIPSAFNKHSEAMTAARQSIDID
jgi:hypothetical protein